jgi:nitrite reductase/ring-hydroxylating ferredoxin subunit
MFELSTGRPISLPATDPVETYPVRVADGSIVVELP